MPSRHLNMVYEDDFDLIADDMEIERNADVLLIHLRKQLNIGKNKHLEIGRHRGMMENDHVAVASYSYEKVKIIKSLSPLLIDLNSNHRKIKCTIKTEDSKYYFLVQL